MENPTAAARKLEDEAPEELCEEWIRRRIFDFEGRQESEQRTMLQAHTARGRQETSPTLRDLCDQLFDVMDRCDLYGARELVRRLRDVQKSSLTRQRRVAITGDAGEIRTGFRVAFLGETLPDSLLLDPSIPTYLAYAQEANCAVTLGSGITTRMPLASLTEYRKSLGQEQSVTRLVVRIPNKKLESGLVLVEVPEPGGLSEADEKTEATENEASRKKAISDASSHAHVTLYCVAAREDRFDEVGRLLGGRKSREGCFVVFEVPVDFTPEAEEQFVFEARAAVCDRFGLTPWQVMAVGALDKARAVKSPGTGMDRIKTAADRLAGLRAQNQLSHEVREAAEEVLEKATRTAEFKRGLLPNPKLRKAVRLAEIALEQAQALAGQSAAALAQFSWPETERDVKERLQANTGSVVEPQVTKQEVLIPHGPELLEATESDSAFLAMKPGQETGPDSSVVVTEALPAAPLSMREDRESNQGAEMPAAPGVSEVSFESGLNSGSPRLAEGANEETAEAMGEQIDSGAVESRAQIESQPSGKPAAVDATGEAQSRQAGIGPEVRTGAGEMGARFAQFATTRASTLGFERRSHTTIRPMPSTFDAGAPEPVISTERRASAGRDREEMPVQRNLSALPVMPAGAPSDEAPPLAATALDSGGVEATSHLPSSLHPAPTLHREETKREERQDLSAPAKAATSEVGISASKQFEVASVAEATTAEGVLAESMPAQPTIFAEWRAAGEPDDDDEEVRAGRRSQWAGWASLAGAIVFTVLMISLIAGRVHPNAISEAWNGTVGRHSRLAVQPVVPVEVDSPGEAEKGVSDTAADKGGEPSAAFNRPSSIDPGSGAYTGISTPQGSGSPAGGGRGGVSASGLAAGYRSEGAVPEPAIQSALNRWVNAYRSEDVSQLASCYAPFVDTYYGLRNLRPVQVAREKANEWRNVASIPVYRVTPISVTDQGNGQKAVLLQKDWSRTTTWGTVSSGSDIERLVLVRIDSEWKIVEEQQVKILRPRRG